MRLFDLMETATNTIAQDLDVLRKMLDSLRLQLAGSRADAGPVHYVQARKMRQKIFPGKYFGDPAWDILVELFIASRSGTVFATSDVGLDTGIPMTTVLRYLGLLEQDGLIERSPDPADGRRVFVGLSERGTRGLMDIFQRPRKNGEAEEDVRLAA